MTRGEAKQVFLSRGYVDVEYGTIYDEDKWKESCRVISEWLEQESSNDMVSREVFEQVMRERDIAINQLKELGYGLGEKQKTGRSR